MCHTALETKAKVVTHTLGTLSKKSPDLAEESNYLYLFCYQLLGPIKGVS